MAEMSRANSQIPIPPLSSSLYLLPLENNRSSQVKESSKRKLEDYLDPILLHTISSRIRQTETKAKQMERKNVFVDTNQRKEFDWPVDRVDSLINDPNRDTARDSGKVDGGAPVFSPTSPSLNKRRRSDFPVWKVLNDNNHG